MKDGRQLRRRSAECAAMVASDRTARAAYGHGGEGPLESRWRVCEVRREGSLRASGFGDEVPLLAMLE